MSSFWSVGISVNLLRPSSLQSPTCALQGEWRICAPCLTRVQSLSHHFARLTDPNSRWRKPWLWGCRLYLLQRESEDFLRSTEKMFWLLTMQRRSHGAVSSCCAIQSNDGDSVRRRVRRRWRSSTGLCLVCGYGRSSSRCCSRAGLVMNIVYLHQYFNTPAESGSTRSSSSPGAWFHVGIRCIWLPRGIEILEICVAGRSVVEGVQGHAYPCAL